MIDALGLSIGTTNLVAAPSSGTATVRRAVLTVYPHRPPEVGVPSENPSLNEQGLVMSGFVDRVGDPVPVVASDGSTYRGERLATDALEALVRSAGPGRPQSMTAAIPAHWRDSAVDALCGAIAHRPALSPGGRPLHLMSDAVTALTALQARSGLPARGIVALCDFGATGTSITLADAAAGFRSLAPTVRYDDFSGDLIDQAVLLHVLADPEIDPSNTSSVVALRRVREQCRIAKERLSLQTATRFTGPLPGPQSTVRLTRAELEALLCDPLDGVIAAVEELLHRNTITSADLVAVATAGGGASIPFVTQRLSEALRLPVITAPHPQVIAAVGASLIARRGPDDEAATGLAMAPLAVGATAAEFTAAHTMPASAAVEPLAWSQDESTDDFAPGGYSDFDDESATDDARPDVRFDHAEGTAMEELAPLPWYRRPGVLFGAAAFVALLAAAGLVLTSRMGGLSPTPAGTTGTTTTTISVAAPPEGPPPPPAQAPPPETVVVQRPAQNPQRQQAPAQRVAPPTQVPSPGPLPTTSTAVVTSTTVVTSTPTTPTTTEQCTPPDCITSGPDPENCGYTGECPDPVTPNPDPTHESCGFTRTCGGGGGTTPDPGGGQTPDPGSGGTGGSGGTEWEHCPADLPPGVVC